MLSAELVQSHGDIELFWCSKAARPVLCKKWRRSWMTRVLLCIFAYWHCPIYLGVVWWVGARSGQDLKTCTVPQWGLFDSGVSKPFFISPLSSEQKVGEGISCQLVNLIMPWKKEGGEKTVFACFLGTPQCPQRVSPLPEKVCASPKIISSHWPTNIPIWWALYRVIAV